MAPDQPHPPNIGAIVHYVSRGPLRRGAVCRAAVVAARGDNAARLDLVVLATAGISFIQDVPRSPGAANPGDTTPVPTMAECHDGCLYPWDTWHVPGQAADAAITPAEQAARAFHARYVSCAPSPAAWPAVPWEHLPEQDQALLITVFGNLLGDGVIRMGN